MNTPSQLLDADGYPTSDWIEFLKTYTPDESLPISKFVETVLPNGWYMADWGFVLRRKFNGKRKLELHTGGWSGNEEVIDAIKSNVHLTHTHMQYVMWKVGGHHYFEINTL